tara:strand:+ start:1038 stop:1523 length:486 start_codon:yes stop_codon:yes gene_type:complete
MKPYRVLACNHLQKIQSEVLEYIEDNTTLLNEKPSEPWQLADTKAVLGASPTLVQWLKEQRVLPTEISFIVYHETGQGLPIHTDDPRLTSKINVPILNTEGNRTLWHDDDDNIIDEYNMLYPVVFNSSIPHSVVIFNKNLPRIIMAVMVNNEKSLLEYLAD